ncbi:MAG: hypothetical protein OK454_02920 [Thaumarchaeota archaeon]|nr:hypothetical protein [Nitrososphaerota archaeon]
MTTKNKKADLTPPDYAQCQCEITMTLGFMQLGGPPKTTERCKSKPTMLMEEREPGEDGQRGSMTVCDGCLKEAQSKMPEDMVIYTRLEAAKYRTDDVVSTKKHPTQRFVVLKHMLSPARKEHTYAVRFEEQTDDKRGFLVWEEDLLPSVSK